MRGEAESCAQKLAYQRQEPGLGGSLCPAASPVSGPQEGPRGASSVLNFNSAFPTKNDVETNRSKVSFSLSNPFQGSVFLIFH